MASTSFPSLSNSFESKIVQNEDDGAVPCILDGKFFVYSKSESTNTKKVAICTSCRPKEVKISGFNNSTSNFVTHLKRRHGEDTYKEYQSHLKNIKKKKQNLRTSCFRRSEISPQLCKETVSQEQFNKNILKFFINSMIPLQAIDDPFFKKMFDDLDITTKGLNVVSRRALGRLIEDYYMKEITKIKSELKDVKEVCTTVDIWSAKTRSFFGVTAHWLGSNLERISKTLACRRLSGTHSYGRIALSVEAIHAEFGLDSQKVLATVTDNGSNFMTAFEEFGIHMDTESDSDGIAENLDIEHIFHQSMNLELPVHLRCSAHKLNLCVTTDANKVLRNTGTTIADIHHQIIKKCNNLWKCGGRPKSAEIIHDIVGHTLSKPEINKWNSLYDGLKQIASIQDKSAQLHLALGLTSVLRTNDFQYIHEYLRCSKPIAEALDILQGEQDMYFGILLPCLLSLRKKLQKLTTESLVFCQTLAENYLENVEVRFSEFFDISSKVAQNAAVASISYPRFKEKWMTCIDLEHHSRIKSVFKGAVIKEIREAPGTFQGTPSKRYEDSYFEFDTDSSETDSIGDIRQVQRSKVDAIISHYLADQDKDVSMLKRHPGIKIVFRKYNTPLPSSGPVERLFPYATMTNLTKSHRLPDEIFEKRLLLKSNLSHTS